MIPGQPGLLPVSAVVADHVVRLAPDATIAAVADALVSGEVGLVVLETGAGTHQDDVVAVVSERDVARAVAERMPVESTPASEIAATHLVWCDASATVADVAVEMFEHYVRHVLVEDDGRFVGVVSARDLLGVYAAADSID
jgi:CBS domain-containing protein